MPTSVRRGSSRPRQLALGLFFLLGAVLSLAMQPADTEPFARLALSSAASAVPFPTLVPPAPVALLIPLSEPARSLPVVSPTLPRGPETPRPVVAAAAAVPFSASELYVHLPPDAAQRGPLRVIIALHGMGGQGGDFASSLLQAADQNGWLLIAPTISYQDYMNVPLLLRDDIQYTARLQATLDVLPARLGLKLKHRAFLFGFSRGAQLAHRFAIFFPEQVSNVAAISAGSYTMPSELTPAENGSRPLLLPFGVADMAQRLGQGPNWSGFKKVNFWLAVGANDTRASDCAREFDAYQGRTRVERAQSFLAALQARGMNARLVIFPNKDHEVAPEMRDAAMRFFVESGSQD